MNPNEPAISVQEEIAGYRLTTTENLSLPARVIPDAWETRLLGELTTTVASGRSKVDTKYSDFPVYGSTGVIGYCKSPEYEGDAILVARVGANAGKLNTVTGKYGVTDNTIILGVKRITYLPFVWRQMESKNINTLIFGSGQPLITGSQIKALTIFVPPIHEQHAIANALSDVDALLAKLDQLISKKRDIKQGAMQELLTGRRRLPGHSGKWQTKKMSDICNISTGSTPSRLNPAYWGTGYKWLTIRDLKSKTVSSSIEEITKRAIFNMTHVPKGTLLMSFKLSIGKLCFAGCDLFTNEAICSFNNLKADAEYLYYALSMVDFGAYGKLAVKGHTLNKESLRSIVISLPEKKEQAAIGKALADLDIEISVLESRRDKMHKIKQGMMQQLLTGKIRLV